MSLAFPPGQLRFEIGGVVHAIRAVHVHPDYDSTRAGTDDANDIAILELDMDATGIAAAKLYRSPPRIGQLVDIVGFGEQHGDGYGTKRVGTAPPADTVGRRVFAWTFASDFYSTSAPGDSGAPLFVRQDGEDYLAGNVSGGNTGDAALGDVAFNTRVDAYLDWLFSLTGPLHAVLTDQRQLLASGPANGSAALYLPDALGSLVLDRIVNPFGASTPTLRTAVGDINGDTVRDRRRLRELMATPFKLARRKFRSAFGSGRHQHRRWPLLKSSARPLGSFRQTRSKHVVLNYSR